MAAHTGTFGANWAGITWTLAIEEQFYLLFPFLVRFCPKTYLTPSIVILIVLAPAARIFLFYMAPTQGFAGHVLLIGRCDTLLIGVLVTQVIQNNTLVSLTSNAKSFIVYTLFVHIAGIAAFVYFGIQAPGFIMTSIGLTLRASFFAFVILYIFLYRDNPLARALNWRPLQFVGIISYGIYLYHQGVSGILHYYFFKSEPRIVDFQSALVTILSLVATISIAWCSFNLLEKQLISKGHNKTHTNKTD